MKLTIDLPDERLADLLCCAFEGGIGYWAQIVDYTGACTWRGKNWDDPPPYVSAPLSPGGAVVLRDCEEEEPGTWRLDRAALHRGLDLLHTLPHHLAAFMGDDEDAVTGDVFVQLALFGEVVYG